MDRVTTYVTAQQANRAESKPFGREKQSQVVISKRARGESNTRPAGSKPVHAAR